LDFDPVNHLIIWPLDHFLLWTPPSHRIDSISYWFSLFTLQRDFLDEMLLCHW
jgi:hypothetical protein